MEKLAISHLEISFHLFINNKLKYNCLKSNDCLNRIGDILGDKLRKNLERFNIFLILILELELIILILKQINIFLL